MVSTLFCDIRGFTPIAERVPPHKMVELLNEHFSAMTEIVFNYKGTLDKYIGDELMAVFGAPIAAEDDALRAARTAVAIQAKNTELNALRLEESRPRLELGVGINTGEVIAGYIGSPMRMEFTSPRTEHIGQMEASSPMTTSPITAACSSTYTRTPSLGRMFL